MAKNNRNLRKGSKPMQYIGWIRLGWKTWKPACKHSIEFECWRVLREEARRVVDPDNDKEMVVLERGQEPIMTKGKKKPA